MYLTALKFTTTTYIKKKKFKKNLFFPFFYVKICIFVFTEIDIGTDVVIDMKEDQTFLKTPKNEK